MTYRALQHFKLHPKAYSEPAQFEKQCCYMGELGYVPNRMYWGTLLNVEIHAEHIAPVQLEDEQNMSDHEHSLSGQEWPQVVHKKDLSKNPHGHLVSRELQVQEDLQIVYHLCLPP